MNEMIPSPTTAVSLFDYSAVPADTATVLMGCEAQIRQTVTRAATELGRLFWTAQSELASADKGVFTKWCESLGYNIRTVEKLIQRFRFIYTYNPEVLPLFNSNPPTINIGSESDSPAEIVENFSACVESLPLSLSYEISKPSAPPELVGRVLTGEIVTAAEYKRQLKASQTPSGWLQLAGGNLPKVGSIQAARKLMEAYKSQCEAIADTLRYAMTGLPLDETEPILWDAIYAARDAEKLLMAAKNRMSDDIKGGINF